jgi:hypothetical protein
MSKNCKNCSKDFEPNHGKQIFCSDNCKVYYSRKKAIVSPTGGVEISKEGSKMSVPDPELTKKRIDWLDAYKRACDYCDTAGISPDDLIEFHKNANKPKLTIAQVVEKNNEKQMTKYDLERRMKKNGF